MRFALLGYVAYFIFNVGVHENHLFLATLLAPILWLVEPRRWPLAAGVIVASNLNLLVFYGAFMRFPRTIGGIDLALPLALSNTVVFALVWANAALRPSIAMIQRKAG